MHYFFYSISIIFLSMTVGVLLNDFLKKKEIYKKLSDLRFIKSSRINKLIGLNFFKWMMVNTFLNRFNPKLKLANTSSYAELERLRQEMTHSELSHFIAFFAVVIVGIYLVLFYSRVFGITLLFLNIFMNLYPSLLQQQNKYRIDKLS